MSEPPRTESDCRVELLSHPDRLTVRVHEELPRDPARPHFVQTRPVDHEYVPRSAADSLAVELERARKTLWKAGFTICADAAGEALAEYRSAYPREETTT